MGSILEHGQQSLLPDPKEPLQVRIPSGLKRRFKATAAMRGIEPNELFVEVWEHYERTHPQASQGISG